MPRSIFPVFLFAVFALQACVSFDTQNASGRYVASPQQCVPYARSVSGVNLYGDAYTWWNQANPPNYMRSRYPSPNSVLVLSQTNKLRHGHVAVVKRVVTSREIEVTHSNWGNDWKTRRMIYDRVRVKDVSANNDWSQVSFWSQEYKNFGFPYAASGFISRVQ